MIGFLAGVGMGIAYYPKRHKHQWQYGVVYDDGKQPRFMVKFCECGEILFDGWFQRKEG